MWDYFENLIYKRFLYDLDDLKLALLNTVSLETGKNVNRNLLDTLPTINRHTRDKHFTHIGMNYIRYYEEELNSICITFNLSQ